MNLPVDEAQRVTAWGGRGGNLSHHTYTQITGLVLGGQRGRGCLARPGGQRGQGRRAHPGGQRGRGRRARPGSRCQGAEAGIPEGKLLGLRALWSAPIPGQRAPCQLLGPPLHPRGFTVGDPTAGGLRPSLWKRLFSYRRKCPSSSQRRWHLCWEPPPSMRPWTRWPGGPSLPCARCRPVLTPAVCGLRSAVCGRVTPLPSRCCSPLRVLSVSPRLSHLSLSFPSPVCAGPGARAGGREFRWWPLLIRQVPQARAPGEGRNVWARTKPQAQGGGGRSAAGGAARAQERGLARAARRALPAVTVTGGPCVWCPAWRASWAQELHPRAGQERGPQEEPRLLVMKGPQRPGTQTPCGPHARGPQAALGLPPLCAWPTAAPLLPGRSHAWRVCVNHPVHPTQAGHSVPCVYTGPSWPPSLLLGPAPPPGLDLLHQDPSPGGLAGEASLGALQRGPAPRSCPLWAAAGRAGPAPDTLPRSPGTAWLELPKPLWPPSLSLSVRENKFRAGCPASPKDACFPEVWPAGPRPFKAPLRLSLTSAPPTPRRPLSHTQRLQGPQPASQSLGALTFESSLVSALRFSNLHVLALP